jgi:hypothetical protein
LNIEADAAVICAGVSDRAHLRRSLSAATVLRVQRDDRLIRDLAAFFREHRDCGELDAAVEGDRVWVTCTCGARIVCSTIPWIGLRKGAMVTLRFVILEHPELDEFGPLLLTLVDTAHTSGIQALTQVGLNMEHIKTSPSAHRRFLRGCHYGFDIASAR